MNEEQNYAQIKYTKFHKNHTRNVEGTDIKCPSVMNGFHCDNSHKMPNQSIHACFGHIQYEAVSKSVEKSKNMGKISFMPLHRLY